MHVENSPSKKSFIKNVLYVLINNGFSVLSGILVGFMIPKIMGVSDYGYYKTFTLYASYIGLFHFGFVDGIYLYYAGKNFDELNKEQFRTFFRFLLLMQFIVMIVITGSSMFFIGSEYFYVILFVGLDVLAINITTYFDFITQITMRFKLLSIRGLLRSTITILSVVVLYFLYRFNSSNISYLIYICIVLAINYFFVIWYSFTYRSISFGKCSGFAHEKEKILSFFKVGIPLLFANLIAQLIFLVDQQFVNIFFDNDTYSTYAFAYNMIGLVTIATGAISTVFYPTLKQMNPESIKAKYSDINRYLLIFVAFCLAAYYPLTIVVKWILPDYISSLDILRIIIPGVLISSSISVIKFNCYKNFNQINRYFIKSLFVLILAVAADIVAYLIFKNTMSISIVSIIVLLVWYIVIEYYFVAKYHVKWIKNFLYMIVCISLFYGTSFIENVYLGGSIYVLAILILTIMFNLDYFKKYYVKKKKEKNKVEPLDNIKVDE